MKTHNETFEELQEQYLKTRDNKTLGKMYELLKKMAYNYIANYCKKKGVRLSIEEKAHDSALYVIEKYLKKPDFYIKKASAYIYFGVLKSLFKNKEREMREVSFEQYYENQELKEEEANEENDL
jgi:hypothetical protein